MERRIAGELEFRGVRIPGDAQVGGGISRGRLRSEIQSRVDLILEACAVKADTARRRKLSRLLASKKLPAQIEAAGHHRCIRRPVMCTHPKFGVKVTALQQNLSRSLQCHVQSHHQRLPGAGALPCPPANIEHSDIGRQAAGNADHRAIQVYGSATSSRVSRFRSRAYPH